MGNYIQVKFQPVEPLQSELLLAELTEIGFEGFEEGEDFLNAFIPEAAFEEAALKEIADKNGLSYQRSVVEETNWNQLWESNFDPVKVDDFVTIRADFHPADNSAEHEIIITPKMSFGTGHHATTFMMMQEMRRLSFEGKNVFDFGTGTGVLAILAARLGAAAVLAIDNDDWSIENARENMLNNGAGAVRLLKADEAGGLGHFDLILANINKNVILASLEALAAQMAPGSTLLLSGLLVSDEADILAAAGKLGLRPVSRREKSNWLCLSVSY